MTLRSDPDLDQHVNGSIYGCGTDRGIQDADATMQLFNGDMVIAADEGFNDDLALIGPADTASTRFFAHLLNHCRQVNHMILRYDGPPPDKC